MKLSIQGIWKHRLSTLVGVLLLAHVVYKFVMGEIALTELAVNLDLIQTGMESVIGVVSLLVEKPANLNNRKKSIS
jgi:hypothetical protein